MKNLLFVIVLLCATTFAIAFLDIAIGLAAKERYSSIMGLDCNYEDLIFTAMLFIICLIPFTFSIVRKLWK